MRALHTNRATLPHQLQAEAAALDGKLLTQFALLGEYDFFSVIDVPENNAAMLLSVGGPAGVRREICPAIDLALFVRLLGQTTETTGPHKWQIRIPARIARRVLRPMYVTRVVRQYAKPLTILGKENYRDLAGPAIFIANHSSHMDGPTLMSSLPRSHRWRTAFGGAADRWFLKGRKGIKV